MNRRVFIFSSIAIILVAFICTIILLISRFIIYPTQIINGQGSINSEQREVKDFTKISSRGNFKISLEASTTESLQITAEENIIPKIVTVVRGDTLYIESERFGLFFLDLINPTKEITVKVFYKDISEITQTVNGSVETIDRLRSDSLTINNTGAGNIKLDIFTNILKVNNTGTGNIELLGTTKEQDVTFNGSGNFNAKTLESKKTTINISGSSSAEFRADEELNIQHSSTGNITYSGNPTKINQNITGTGKVQKAD